MSYSRSAKGAEYLLTPPEVTGSESHPVAHPSVHRRDRDGQETSGSVCVLLVQGWLEKQQPHAG